MKRSMLHALALMMLFLHPILHAQSGTLCGTVTGYRGAPMSDAVVRLSDSTFFRSAWLADSTFTIPDIAPGDYTLDISAPGFIPERYEMTILAGQRARIAGCMRPAAARASRAHSRASPRTSPSSRARATRRPRRWRATWERSPAFAPTTGSSARAPS